MAIAMAAAKVLSSAEHREAKWSRMALRKNWWSCIIPPKAGGCIYFLIFWIFLEIFFGTQEKTDLPNIVTAGSSLVSRHSVFLHGSMFLRGANEARPVDLSAISFTQVLCLAGAKDRNRGTMYASTVYMFINCLYACLCGDYMISYNMVIILYDINIMLSLRVSTCIVPRCHKCKFIHDFANRWDSPLYWCLRALNYLLLGKYASYCDNNVCLWDLDMIRFATQFPMGIEHPCRFVTHFSLPAK